MAEFQRGDKVKIIAGQYTGTVGTWTGKTVTCNTGDFNIFGTQSLEKVSNDTKMCEVYRGKLIWTE